MVGVTLPRNEEKLLELLKQESERRAHITFPTDSYLRVIEPLRFDSPESRLKQLKGLLLSKNPDDNYEQLQEYSIIDRYMKQRGREDVPPYRGNTRGAARNILGILYWFDQGYDVYQYTVLPGKPDLQDPPDGWLSIKRVSELKDVQIRTVKEYCVSEDLTAVQTNAGWFVKPDIHLDYWLTKIPSYGALLFRLGLLKEALEEHPETLDELYTGVVFLEESYGINPFGQYEKVSMESFFKLHIQECPDSVDAWQKNIDPLIQWAKQQTS